MCTFLLIFCEVCNILCEVLLFCFVSLPIHTPSVSVSECRCDLAPVTVPVVEVTKKKEKVPKILDSAPILPLEKPVVTDVDYYNIDLSWSEASLPPNSTPTSFTYVTETLKSQCFSCSYCISV